MTAVHPARSVFHTLRRLSPETGARVRWALNRLKGDFSTRVVERLVGPGDVVVDIGAHWGLFTWRLASLVGPQGVVHSIEPHPDHRESLERLHRRFPWVSVHMVAATDRAGHGQLHVPRSGRRRMTALATLTPAGRRGGSQDVLTVPTSTLDLLLRDEKRPVRFIKCDVEGHEPAVLRGARHLIEQARPTLLVEIEQRHRDDDISSTFSSLSDLGYAGYAVYSDGLRSIASFDVDRDQKRYLADFGMHSTPKAYVHDFLFVDPSTTDVAPLAASGRAEGAS